ncbi:hypothetical protein C8J57DRAFT_1481297 [Mycena rebaudengoi]|nr:hypothetical protein C8J57DRAFT_1481297 [Mycena rebaudengoi]
MRITPRLLPLRLRLRAIPPHGPSRRLRPPPPAAPASVRPVVSCVHWLYVHILYIVRLRARVPATRPAPADVLLPTHPPHRLSRSPRPPPPSSCGSPPQARSLRPIHHLRPPIVIILSSPDAVRSGTPNAQAGMRKDGDGKKSAKCCAVRRRVALSPRPARGSGGANIRVFLSSEVALPLKRSALSAGVMRVSLGSESAKSQHPRARPSRQTYSTRTLSFSGQQDIGDVASGARREGRQFGFALTHLLAEIQQLAQSALDGCMVLSLIGRSVAD